MTPRSRSTISTLPGRSIPACSRSILQIMGSRRASRLHCAAALLCSPGGVYVWRVVGKARSMPNQASVERRLAAILAADVVGYSSLMETDEVGILFALKAIRRDLVDPTIARHNGRIVKTTGDGFLV